ncbi:MAG: hypothetical protein Q8K62_07000 [Thiobacillus sp.]|nr:hypothetical protein [Thiobacillus sp.]
MLRIILCALLTALPSVGYAYDRYKQALKSVFNAEAICISVITDHRFFDPLKNGESVIDKLKSDGDEVDKAFAPVGRVQKNIKALLSDKFQSQLSLKTVDCDSAPYLVWVEIKADQSLDVIGSNLYEIKLQIDLREKATTVTGYTGFISVYSVNDQEFATSKAAVEAQVYKALDDAFEKLRKVFTEASTYCSVSRCK